MKSLSIYLAAVAAVFAVTAARADDCRLNRVASLDITLTDDGRVLIPVSIDGAQKLMMIDTGSPLSTIDRSTVMDLDLKTRRMYEGELFNSLGQSFTEFALVPSLGIDQAHASDLKFPIEPTSLSDDKRVAGLLGADLLRHYDIELDFTNGKINFFLQDHCPGKVIYWPASTVAVVPFHMVESGHIILPVELDGKSVDALLDTGAGHSILDLETAEHQFGLQPGSADMTPEGTYGGDAGVPAYSHVFKTLGFDGIAIANPKVFIFSEMGSAAVKAEPGTGTRLSESGTSNGVVPMILGRKELGRLHLFISYKEQKLYITPPSPPASAPVQSAAH